MHFEFHYGRRHAWEPHIDVCERASEIVVFVEIPGVERKDIQITWNDGVLAISGEKQTPPITGIVRHHCIERTQGHFRREIAINAAVDHEKARAELRDGLMRIYLPKTGAVPKSGKIPISEQGTEL